MIQSIGFAAKTKSAPFERWEFERRDAREDDVVVEILYSGICHSDIHQVRDEWGSSQYPMVPGHEIVGRITKVGPKVTRFDVGDLAGVGVMVNSCRVCNNCKAHEEAYCDKGFVGTYNALDYDNTPTYGGYANNIVVHEGYVHTISKKLESKLAEVAPFLCAGITSYSPLRHWKVGPGKKVGVVGLGGLGHMGLKFAHAFGAKVTLFTTSAGKEADAKRLGADEVVMSKDAEAMAHKAASFDFILDCVSAKHDINQYLGLLKLNGTICLVGLPEEPIAISSFATAAKRRSLAGSMIGGMKETQEMLDFCAEHDIVSEVELIAGSQIDAAYERVLKSDVKCRFVIDMSVTR